MKIYDERPLIFENEICEKYELNVCFDEILDRKPKIEIKELSKNEIKEYITTYEKIHDIIYQEQPQQKIIDALEHLLNNEKTNTRALRKSLNFLNFNISLSLSHIYQETKIYNAIFVLFDIIVRLKMNKQILSIYPLIMKINNKKLSGINYLKTSKHEIEKVRAISYNYDKIQTILSHIDNIIDKLVFAIYHLFYVRVSKEYKIMLVKKGDDNIDNSKNYYDYDNKTFIFTDNKYSIKYDEYSIDKKKYAKIRLPKELSNIIDEYIDKKGIENDNKLMPFNIEKRLYNILKKVYGYDYTSIDLKKIYLLNIDRNILQWNNRIRQVVYVRMNTNLQEVMKFVYQDLIGEGFDSKYCKLIIQPTMQLLKIP